MWGMLMSVTTMSGSSLPITTRAWKPFAADLTRASGRAVLVIDEEQTALDLMQATLTSIGIGSVACLDARQALSEIDTHRPDAITLDLMMPGFDGFQVLDELQRLPAWRHAPVFIWTSMLLTDDDYSALARSARAIMGKGGGAIADVLERVRRWRPPVVTNSVTPSD
jgi:CheY-like chemotaxis protein